jgi:glucokinase
MIASGLNELQTDSNWRLAAIGVAVPGPVKQEEGRVLIAGNLREWIDVPLSDMLGKRFGVPISIERDANAAALGEGWRGVARSMNNFVFLALGTGVGAGVVVNGRLHRGYHEVAGEVGNFVMDRSALDQERGVHGHLELLVGGPWFRDRTSKAADRKMSNHEAFAVARNNDVVQQEVDAQIDFISMAVINIVALLDPQAIIFGGGLGAVGTSLIEPVRAKVKSELRVVPTIVQSALGEDAQLHGALFGALWELDPSLALREDLR